VAATRGRLSALPRRSAEWEDGGKRAAVMQDRDTARETPENTLVQRVMVIGGSMGGAMEVVESRRDVRDERVGWAMVGGGGEF